MQSHPGLDAFANNDKVWALLDGMAEIAKAHGVTVAQVALRWLLQKRSTTSIVIGCKNVEQLHDNLKCLSFKLTDQVRAAQKAFVRRRWALGGAADRSTTASTRLLFHAADAPHPSRPLLLFAPSLQDMSTLDALSFTANFGEQVPYPYEMVWRINNPRKRPLGK
jgi:hypothetical protein